MKTIQDLLVSWIYLFQQVDTLDLQLVAEVRKVLEMQYLR